VARLGESGELCKCSFCGRGQSQVQKLIAGPGVYICDDCVDLCCEMMDIEEIPPPRRYNARFSLETVVANWVDGINHQDGARVQAAREFLEGLLSRLDSYYQRPRLLPPSGDPFLVALGRSPGRDLHAPAKPVQQQIQPRPGCSPRRTARAPRRRCGPATPSSPWPPPSNATPTPPRPG
jgi:hypothetical protein